MCSSLSLITLSVLSIYHSPNNLTLTSSFSRNIGCVLVCLNKQIRDEHHCRPHSVLNLFQYEPNTKQTIFELADQNTYSYESTKDLSLKLLFDKTLCASPRISKLFYTLLMARGTSPESSYIRNLSRQWVFNTQSSNFWLQLRFYAVSLFAHRQDYS